jgi:2'-5' RNA ligase
MRPETVAPTERLFLGVPLPPAAQATLSAQLPADLPGRPVPPHNWHVTLRFLGSTPADRRDELIANIRSAHLPRGFDVAFGGLGAFPSPRRAKVVWVGVREGGAALEALADLAEVAAVGAGFEPQTRPFHSHLTISRLRHPGDVTPLLRHEVQLPVRVSVTALALFRSTLGTGPARYEIRELFSLTL